MKLHKKVEKMIQIGYWPGFIVGMYPSQFAYKPIEVDFESLFKNTTGLNLYIHVPFCKSKCTFCTFFSIAKNDPMYFEEYFTQLIEQLRFYNQFFKTKKRIMSICFGGGTPNIADISQYKRLFDALRECNVVFDENLEPSMEISPELITPEYIKGLREVGIKRVSLGVQSLKSEIRNNINRPQAIDMDSIMQMLRTQGLNVNLDVINGIPGQTKEEFMETLVEITKYMPETISIYPLSGDGNSLFKKNNTMSSAEKYQLFDVYHEYLTQNNYDCESHVKFVKKNQSSTHQQKIYEYQGVETLGIGCGARSYMEDVHFAAPYSANWGTTINQFMASDPKALEWHGFQMNSEENMRRHIIYSFFLGTLDLKEFSARYGMSFGEKFPEEFEALTKNKLVHVLDNRYLVLTTKGRKYTDLIGVMFWSKSMHELEKVF